jgi:hypothetical protein
MVDNLRTAGAKRKTQRNTLGGKTSTTPTTTPTATPTAAPTSPSKGVSTGGSLVSVDSSGQIALSVPGSIQVQDIAGSIKVLDRNSYQILDPLHPPETLPRVNQRDFELGSRVYAESINGLKLIGLEADHTREQFNVLGKQAGAFEAGVKAATAYRKVEGAIIDHETQVQLNVEKGNKYQLATHRVANGVEQLIVDKQISDEQLSASRTTLALLQTQNREKENKLLEMQKQVGVESQKQT